MTRTLGACVGLGAVGLLILGVQPLLYNIYVRNGLIPEEQLGLLAALEIAAIAFGSAVGIRSTSALSVKWVGIIGVTIFAIGNLLPDTIPIMLARPVAGLGGGLLASLAAMAIAIAVNVNRFTAIYLFVQAASQYVVLQWFSGVGAYERAFDIQVVFVIVALVAVSILLPFVSNSLGQTYSSDGTAAEAVAPSRTGYLALVAAGLFLGGSICIWAYLGVWLEFNGIAPGKAAQMLAVCLAGQMVGTVLAGVFSKSSKFGSRIIVSALVLIFAVSGMLWIGVEGLSGWLLVILFGLSWQFIVPATTAFIEEADPARGALPYSTAANLTGAAIFPAVLGYLFATQNMDHVLVAGMVVIFASLVVIIAIMVIRRREGDQAIERVRFQ